MDGPQRNPDDLLLSCQDKLHYTLDQDKPPPLWVPDIYFENAQRNDLAHPNDGVLLESYPSGEVFMVQRMRVTINCEMALHRYLST